jgi:hypothetical protein
MIRITSIALLCALASCGESDAATPAAKAQGAPNPATASALDRETVHAFCVANYETQMLCLDDDSYWQIMATLYFQTDPKLAANPAAKEPWIAMMKDVARTLDAEDQLSANCDAAVDHNQWPTRTQIERVNAARDLSCADFGNAFGYMMFGEGAFFVTTSPVDG